jgi:hypothetical protein
MAGVSQMLIGKMAEWLRPRIFIAEIGLNIRRIRVRSKSCPSKKTIGWAHGNKNHVLSFQWQAEADFIGGIEILSLKKP